jgi:hypothetical protein
MQSALLARDLSIVRESTISTTHRLRLLQQRLQQQRGKSGNFEVTPVARSGPNVANFGANTPNRNFEKRRETLDLAQSSRHCRRKKSEELRRALPPGFLYLGDSADNVSVCQHPPGMRVLAVVPVVSQDEVLILRDFRLTLRVHCQTLTCTLKDA